MTDTKTIDQQFIEYVVSSLVSKPEAVLVERKIDEKGVLLTLTVDPDDLGRVIGKRGATAQSLRTLLRALGTKQEARFNLKIVDNGIPREEREQQRSSNEQPSRNDDESSSEGSGWASAPSTNSDDEYSSDDSVQSDSDPEDTSAAQVAANDSGEEESEMSTVERTRRELEDLDDLDV